MDEMDTLNTDQVTIKKKTKQNHMHNSWDILYFFFVVIFLF